MTDSKTNTKAITIATNDSIDSRIAKQSKLDIFATSTMKRLTQASVVFASKDVKLLLKSDKIDVAALAAIDMKAISRAASIVTFALAKRSSAENNVREVFMSIVKHSAQNEAFTLKSAEIALNADVKLNAKQKKLFVQRDTVFASFTRHANMCMLALRALNVVTLKDKSYSLNAKSNIAKMMQERYAA